MATTLPRHVSTYRYCTSTHCIKLDIEHVIASKTQLKSSNIKPAQLLNIASYISTSTHSSTTPAHPHCQHIHSTDQRSNNTLTHQHIVFTCLTASQFFFRSCKKIFALKETACCDVNFWSVFMRISGAVLTLRILITGKVLTCTCSGCDQKI